MRERSSIKFEIPVPWSATPLCIEAKGRQAVAVAGIVGIIAIAMLLL